MVVVEIAATAPGQASEVTGKCERNRGYGSAPANLGYTSTSPVALIFGWRVPTVKLLFVQGRELRMRPRERSIASLLRPSSAGPVATLFGLVSTALSPLSITGHFIAVSRVARGARDGGSVCCVR